MELYEKFLDQIYECDQDKVLIEVSVLGGMDDEKLNVINKNIKTNAFKNPLIKTSEIELIRTPNNENYIIPAMYFNMFKQLDCKKDYFTNWKPRVQEFVFYIDNNIGRISIVKFPKGQFEDSEPEFYFNLFAYNIMKEMNIKDIETLIINRSKEVLNEKESIQRKRVK